MLGIKEIKQALKVRSAITNDMFYAIQTWTDMYEGKAPWLRKGTPDDPVRVVSLGLPALISSEKARMATLEMESEITPPMKDVEKKNEDYQAPGIDDNGMPTMGSGAMIVTESEPDGPTERADFLNTQYKKLKDNIRTQLEYGVAMGGLVIKPYLKVYDSGSVQQKRKDDEADSQYQSYEKELPKYEFEFDYVQAGRFYPLAFEPNGKITEACFAQTKVDKDVVYTRLEHHKLVGRQCIIENFAFKKNNTNDGRYVSLHNTEDNLGRAISLTEVPEWASISPRVVIDNVDRLLFAYFKMPEANTIDTYSPLGVSGFSRVVDLIRDADEQYSRLLWEFEGGELAIDVDRDAMKIQEYQNGQHQTVMPIKQERLFRKVDLNSEETYNVFSPALRDASLINGLNMILMRIEDATGLSRGTISEQISAEAKTATEMKILKQRSYQTNADIQSALEKALRDTVYAMDVYCSLYDVTPEGEYEMSFEWDDSILVDTDTELEHRLSMINAGLASKLETRMWYFGETENQAKAALQRIEDEKKASMETNIVAQQQLGEVGQGKDFSGDNNNPGSQKQNATTVDKTQETK
jgi:A118 family predicted phage portal protein